MMNAKYVAYARVSTKVQGRSGLGIEGQCSAVRDFVLSAGGSLIREYVEIESGRAPARPELAKALRHAKRAGAILIVAKIDRLARNVHFLSGLLESGVDFVVCDNPAANRFTIHVLAAVAEHEASQISDRTRAALAAAKRRGVKLGSARPDHWSGREGSRAEGQRKATASAAVAKRERARQAYSDLAPFIRERSESGTSLQQIADALNAEGHTTRTGSAFGKVQVKRILDREQ